MRREWFITKPTWRCVNGEYRTNLDTPGMGVRKEYVALQSIHFDFPWLITGVIPCNVYPTLIHVIDEKTFFCPLKLGCLFSVSLMCHIYCYRGISFYKILDIRVCFPPLHSIFMIETHI